MKSEFYDKKKRAHIYKAIFTYKILTLFLILFLNFVLAFFFFKKLTGLPNRYSCDLLIQEYSESDKLPSLGFILMQLNNLKDVNSGSSHKEGNNLIAEFSSILEDVGNEYGYIGRNGGNEFIVLLEDCDNTKIDMFLMDLTKRIHGYNELNVGAPIEVSYSKVLNSLKHMDKITDVISLGYRRIHEIPQILS